jgi:hypothetical protein
MFLQTPGMMPGVFWLFIVVFNIMLWCGTLAEWLRSGLQNRVHGFESRRCLHFTFLIKEVAV